MVMEAYAIIESGGKQYRVEEGNIVDLEKLSEDVGASVEFDALAVSDGEKLNLDGGSKVTGEIVEQLRGKKIIAYKKKRRKGYERKVGHRQDITRVKITGLAG